MLTQKQRSPEQREAALYKPDMIGKIWLRGQDLNL